MLCVRVALSHSVKFELAVSRKILTQFRFNKICPKILVDYGLTKQKGDEFPRKTSDRLEFNSVAGKQVEDSNWFYSFFTNFRTRVRQFHFLSCVYDMYTLLHH